LDKKQLIGKIESVRQEINQSFENKFIDFDKINTELGSVVTELGKIPDPAKIELQLKTDKQTVYKKSVRTSDFN